MSQFTISSSTSRVSLKGNITPCFPLRTLVASAVANRLTKHLSDLQIHNGLECTVLEVDVGKVCHCWVCITSESSQACRLERPRHSNLLYTVWQSVLVPDGLTSTGALHSRLHNNVYPAENLGKEFRGKKWFWTLKFLANQQETESKAGPWQPLYRLYRPYLIKIQIDN